MKYHEKRKHVLIKIIIGLIILLGLFFALCDCAPKQQPQETVIVFERN